MIEAAQSALKTAGQKLITMVFVIILFPIVAVFVAVNLGNTADRLAWLPGVSEGGGAASGLAIVIYPLIVVAIIGIPFALVGEGSVVNGESGDSANGDEDPPDADEGNGGDGEGETENGGEETDENGDTDEEGVEDAITPTAIDLELEALVMGNDAAREMVENERDPMGEMYPEPIESGELVVNDSLGETVFTADLDDSHTVHVDNLTGGETYTATVYEANGGEWPPEEFQFDPSDTDELAVTVGYQMNGNQSFEFIYYTQNYTVHTQHWTGHGKAALNGEAWGYSGIIRNLERDSVASFNERYWNPFEDQLYYTNAGIGYWEEINGSLTRSGAPSDFARYGIGAVQREYIETLTLEDTIVNETVTEVDPPGYDVGAYEWQMSGARDAYRYVEGTEVHKYRLRGNFTEGEYAYVDPDTGYMLQRERVETDYDDGRVERVHTFFNFGEYAEIEKYDPDGLTIQD